MGNRPPKLILILIPVIIFLLVLIFFLVRLPKPQPSSTSVSPTPSPTSTPSLITPENGLKLLIQQIAEFQVEDPQFTPPNFDRKISLPIE